VPDLFKSWPQRDGLTPDEVVQLYQSGFAGALKATPEMNAEFDRTAMETGGAVYASDAATAYGWAGSHEGKLVIPFVHVEKAYPGCWPGPAQARGDCVSHSGKNARLVSMVCDVVSGQADEVTGKVEGFPEVPAEGIKAGVLSTESAYWFRGHGGDGWQCEEDATVAVKHAGCVLRKDYPEIGIDLTRYSGSLAGKWGRSAPPSEIRDALDNNLIRTATRARSFEEIRDLLGNGYGVSSCGSEGFSSKRDESGVSDRKGSWAHAMAYIGADDREETKKKHGGGLVLVLNSWGKWNSGPRQIEGTSIDIPDGSFWARWKDVSRRSAIAFSAVNGWPRKQLPDLNPGW
jgi:hypothetical protein